MFANLGFVTFIMILIILLFSAFRILREYERGVVFLLGGIAASFMIPAPAWFIVLDLVVAYLPMAWLAGRLGARLRR